MGTAQLMKGVLFLQTEAEFIVYLSSSIQRFDKSQSKHQAPCCKVSREQPRESVVLGILRTAATALQIGEPVQFFFFFLRCLPATTSSARADDEQVNSSQVNQSLLYIVLKPRSILVLRQSCREDCSVHSSTPAPKDFSLVRFPSSAADRFFSTCQHVFPSAGHSFG